MGFLYNDGGGSFDVIEGGDEYYDDFFYDSSTGDFYWFDYGDGNAAALDFSNDWFHNWEFDPYADLNEVETIFVGDTREKYLPEPQGVLDWEYNQVDYSQLPGGHYDPWADFYANVPDAPPAAAAPRVPGYCPNGYYHPMSDPFACVPFPANDAAAKRAAAQAAAKKQAQQKAAQAAAQKAAQAKQAAAQKCPTGYVLNPQTKKCVKAPAQNALVSRTPAPSKTALPWWVWAIGAAVALKVVSGDGDSTARRRRR